MVNSCVCIKTLVNKLLNSGEKKQIWAHYIHPCKSELLPPAVVKQVGSLHDDMLQLRFVVVVSIITRSEGGSAAVLVAFLCNAVKKNQSSCLKSL